jgi:GAF domain-containing protein
MFNISDNLSNNKNEMHKEIFEYAKMLVDGENDYVANLANISSLLNQALKDINWVGFYIVRNNQLVLGPFQGKAACIRINKDQGVCGVAYAKSQTQLVEDVHAFAGHIACASDTSSEIVVPIVVKNSVVAVLDIDSPLLNRFDETDKEHLEILCELIAKSCNWTF